MSIATILKTSYGVIVRRFPERNVLQSVSVQNIVFLYAVSVVVPFAATFFLLEASDVEQLFYWNELIIVICGYASYTYVSKYFLNKYSIQKFSTKEVLAFWLLLTFASTCIYTTGDSMSLLSSDFAFIWGLLSIIFTIYMLLTLQHGISVVASITKSQASYVLLAPLLPMILLASALFFLTL